MRFTILDTRGRHGYFGLFSTNCVHVVFRFVRGCSIFIDAETEKSVQPKVVGMTGHESRCSPKLDNRRHFSPLKSVVTVFPKLDGALIGDEDQRFS
jgi:hypothetical protein